MNIYVQKYHVDIKGNGIFCVKSSEGNTLLIPNVGFDKDGKSFLSGGMNDDSFVFPEQEWIEKYIVELVDSHINTFPKYMDMIDPISGNKFKVPCSQTDTLYVFLFTREGFKNQIGVQISDSPFVVEDSSLTFDKDCEYLINLDRLEDYYKAK